MKILLITEKYKPKTFMRDGGARIVNTLKESFNDALTVMQFGSNLRNAKDWCFDYPTTSDDRFQQRITNAEFIAQKIKEVEEKFTHIIFVHVSMQFGIIDIKLKNDIIIWTFPMFLTPSYKASGEVVPDQYTNLEKLALKESDNIITPSHFEKEQLINYYSISKEKIHVIPRGVETNLLHTKVLSASTDLKLCSIGSIKPQKNILGLIDLFYRLLKKIPSAKLKIIGAIQNDEYYREVRQRIKELAIDSKSIEFTGYLPPKTLYKIAKDCQIHVSRSNCETFGRSIFETLACGMPNVAKKTCNAAAEFLEDKPYAKFIDDEEQSVNTIIEMLDNLSHLSSMALEIRKLYDNEILSKLLVAKIYDRETIAISDFDGTLFHKEDATRTLQSIKEFKKFPLKVICSARATKDLLQQLKILDLEVDWIIAFSGAVVTDGTGNIILSVPLILNETFSELLMTEAEKIEHGNQLMQLAVPTSSLAHNYRFSNYKFRSEVYNNTAYIADWESSKIHAIHKLLKHINWSGQVKVFGNGRYDMEMIKYFDGIKISA